MIGLWLALAHGELPLPDYGRELARATWLAIDRDLTNGCDFDPAQAAFVCGEGVTQRARDDAEAWMSAVREDPGLRYLVGLAWRYDGEDAKAIAAWEASVAADPDYLSAWYDLGELHLVRGRYDRAAMAFERVAELKVDGEGAWLGPWRRAEVAAHQHDAPTFERWMHEALRRGFSFRQIAGQPQWRTFFADPALRDSVEKLITVYATPDVLDTLR